MEDNNNWPNFPSNNAPRPRLLNPGVPPRPLVNRGNLVVDTSLPPPYTSSGNRQNNPHAGCSSSTGPAYGSEGQSNYPKYFKTKSFPQNRPAPYNRPHHSRHPHSIQKHHSFPQTTVSDDEPTSSVSVKLTPLEAKIEKLLAAVRAQKGIMSDLVFLQAELDNPTVILQNAVQSLKNGILTVKNRESSQIFELRICGEKMAEGKFQNKQLAKNSLCETVLNDLKKKCFYIIKKKSYEEISTDDISNAKKDIPANVMEGSKAHAMMLKMGWGGKGLGSNEQGIQVNLADTITRNITKEGLGGKDVMNEIHNILEEFAKSTKVTILAFHSGFTKEERAHIHLMAGKFNLKSKSEGKDDNRRITISKKISKWDLVKELLLVDCENNSYKLIIPSEFEGVWADQ